MGAYDDLLPVKKASAGAYDDLFPETTGGKVNSWVNKKIKETQDLLDDNLPVKVGSGIRAMFQSVGDVGYGLAETLMNQKRDYLPGPDKRLTPDLGDAVTKAIRDREARYQSETADSPESYIGRGVGAVAPYVVNPLKAAVSVPFEAGGALAKTILPNSPRIAKVVGNMAGGAANVPLITALQPSNTSDGKTYEESKSEQEKMNMLLALGLPPVLAGAGGLAKTFVGKPLTSLSNVLDTLFMPGGDKRAGGRIMNEAAGDLRPQIEAALKKNIGANKTAAQSVVDVGSTEVPALQKIVDQVANPTGADAVRQGQIAGRQRGIESVTPNVEKVAALKKDVVSERLSAEYKKANEAGEKLPEFVARMEAKYKGQKEYLTQLGKFASLENQSLNMAGKAVDNQNKFGWLPKAERHLTNARSYGEAAQEAADLYKGVSSDKAFIQRQMDSLADSGHKPLTAKSLFSEIDDIALAPGESDKATQSLMKGLRSEVQAMVDLNLARLTKGMTQEQAAVFSTNYKAKFGDIIDAKDAHQLRKTGIGLQIEKLAQEYGPSTSKHLASGVLKVKNALDAALEGAGADGFSKTLRINQRLSRAQDQGRALKELKTQLKPEVSENADAFLNRTGKDSKTFLDSLGIFETDMDKFFSPAQKRKILSIRNELNVDTRVDELAKQGFSKARKITHTDELPTAPGFVDAKITILNKAKNIIEGKGEDSAFKALQKAMAPREQKALLEMMNSADPKLRKAAMDVFKRYGPDAKQRLLLGSKFQEKRNQEQ